MLFFSAVDNICYRLATALKAGQLIVGLSFTEFDTAEKDKH